MTPIHPAIVPILYACAEACGVSPFRVIAKRRTRTATLARHLAMWLTRERTNLSLGEIGESFRRDHSTVSYACKRVAQRVEAESDLEALVQTIIKRIERQGVEVTQ